VYQISRQSHNIFVFDNFHTLTKRIRKKMKKLSQFLKVHISETLSWNLECEVMTLVDISTIKIIWFYYSVTELRIHENCTIVLPVNNSQAGLLGCMTHYCVSWLTSNYFVSNGKYPTFADLVKLNPTITVILMAKFNPTITAYLVPYITEGYDN